MAEKRKLMLEVEKCFKKIDEGIEIFEETMKKVKETTNESKREKIQDELKKEIKKLQRLREQVKGWQGSSEIKEKEKLGHYRRLIETHMENFKDVEREFKTKPHSKQGLAAEEKIDPKVKEKEDTLDWLKSVIQEIQDEIDRTEAKIEKAKNDNGKKRGKGKKKTNDDDSVNHLERVNFHLTNLEVCRRMLMNDKLSSEDVNKLKDPMEMYISALSSDCEDDPTTLEPDYVYDELGLGDYVSQIGASHATEDETSHKEPAESPVVEEPPKAKYPPVKAQKPAPHPKTVAQTNVPSVQPQSLTRPTLADQLSPEILNSQPVHRPAVKAPIVPPVPSVLPAPIVEVPKPVVSESFSFKEIAESAAEALLDSFDPTPDPPLQTKQLPYCFAGYSLEPRDKDSNISSVLNNQEYLQDSRVRYNQLINRSHLPVHFTNDCPEWYLRNISKCPLTVERYSMFDIKTVLFSFYYMEGTRAQYLAAKVLKNFFWRFHTGYLMWFQRVTDPSEVTEDYERGTYSYFDWSEWILKTVDDFVFEYKFLEDYVLS